MKARISGFCFAAFFLFAAGTLWGFPGFTSDTGTHMDITRTAAAKRFDIPPGTVKRECVIPIYGIHWFTWETAYYADLFCEANRDIDIYYFGPIEAHSQSTSYSQDRRFTEEELKSFELDAVCRSLSFYAGLMERVERIEVCEGYPAEEILQQAKKLDCDLIVMGSHGKGLLENTFVGSVTRQVLRRTRLPVTVIPLPKGQVEEPPGAGAAA